MALPKSHHRTVGLVASLAVAVSLVGPAAASAHTSRSHGQVLHLLGGGTSALSALNASKSTNWFGYNRGALEPGGALFHAITGSWVVPRVSQHAKHQAEYSSDWIGIGGGCDNSSCSVTDSSLIQTGTEQDVGQGGRASYSAWWEVIPAPSTPIGMKVHPGDHMHAALTMTAPNVWKIAIKDITHHESFSTTVPYSSTMGSAEWIEETPLIIGSNAGLAPLPNLTSPHFDHATANGHPAMLNTTQKVDLTNSSGKVVGAPSAPDPDHDGFNACAWAKTCGAPRHS
jgi:hypothetical protein